MFATIVIVLPSEFTGGAVHLSHNDKSEVYNASENSKMVTTVMGWYTDVKHEVKPVESGYRLALSYNLIRTTTFIRPPVRANDRISAALDKVFSAWSEYDDGPAKIIFRLDHAYSEADLCGSALKGGDAERVALLRPIANRYNFKLGLAHLTCSLLGEWDGGNTPPVDDADIHTGFVASGPHTREAKITNLVSLRGNPVVDALPHRDDFTIPKDLCSGLEYQESDDDDIEEYTGNVSQPVVSGCRA